MIRQEWTENFGPNLETSCQKRPTEVKTVKGYLITATTGFTLTTRQQRRCRRLKKSGFVHSSTNATVQKHQAKAQIQLEPDLVNMLVKTFRCISCTPPPHLQEWAVTQPRCQSNKCLCSRYSVSMLIAGNHCKHFFSVLWKQGLTGGQAGRRAGGRAGLQRTSRCMSAQAGALLKANCCVGRWNTGSLIGGAVIFSQLWVQL